MGTILSLVGSGTQAIPTIMEYRMGIIIDNECHTTENGQMEPSHKDFQIDPVNCINHYSSYDDQRSRFVKY